jgi:hypothetical protein
MCQGSMRVKRLDTIWMRITTIKPKGAWYVVSFGLSHQRLYRCTVIGLSRRFKEQSLALLDLIWQNSKTEQLCQLCISKWFRTSAQRIATYCTLLILLETCFETCSKDFTSFATGSGQGYSAAAYHLIWKRREDPVVEKNWQTSQVATWQFLQEEV